jgi:hypothetical protein
MAGRFAHILTATRHQLVSDIEAGTILTPTGNLDPEATLLYFNQLHHLDANEHGERMLAYTKQAQQAGDQMLTYTHRMLWFTVAVTVLTLINVVLVAWTIATH